ncbi:MAG: ATP-binding protein [Candidatus Azobacteroides sp.]|nr:ATP-binding protein [Candidatus Azobacteroides sp.]
MRTDQVKISIKDFRAIEEAEIALNGITVVAGENGCGKSTISKLLYYVVQSMSNYEQIIIDLQLKPYVRIICDSLLSLISYYKIDSEQKNQLQRLAEVLYVSIKISFIKTNLLTFVENIKLILLSIKQLEKTDSPDYDKVYEHIKNLPDWTRNRLINLLEHIDTLERFSLLEFEEFEDTDSKNIVELFQMLCDNINTKTTKLEEISNSKNNLILKEYLFSIFGHFDIIGKHINISEYGNTIFDENSFRFIPLDYFNNAIYIDTPMAIDASSADCSYWDDLNSLLKKQYNNHILDSEISSLLKKNILKGEIKFQKGTFNRFTYKRDDGEEFNLRDCATGVKSFAMLQLLLNNGSLTHKTLLILDEPEAHLHPQWIIEYARLLVLLNKEIGVKFFIASHSPDMVSALKYISEKEKKDKNLNFYIAKKGKKPFQYKYKHLGTDIGEIFDSYNISYEKLDKYGATE